MVAGWEVPPKKRPFRGSKRPIRIESSYYYDPFGRRLWKEVAGVRTYFVYADEGLVAEVDEAGNVVKTYGYRPGSTWTTDPLFMKVSGVYYFYQNDHLGTPQKLTAVNGAVVWSAKYSSFGEADVDPSFTITNNLRFPGQYFDQETGLHYNWHRYYDPVSGRYLRPDPIGLIGGVNLFIYVLNNSNKWIDPLGLREDIPDNVRDVMNYFDPYTETVSDDIGYWEEPIPPIYDDVGIYPIQKPFVVEDDIGIYDFNACPKGYHYDSTTGQCYYGKPDVKIRIKAPCGYWNCVFWCEGNVLIGIGKSEAIKASMTAVAKRATSKIVKKAFSVAVPVYNVVSVVDTITDATSCFMGCEYDRDYSGADVFGPLF
jgi:RHS repeat-associated protein